MFTKLVGVATLAWWSTGLARRQRQGQVAGRYPPVSLQEATGPSLWPGLSLKEALLVLATKS